MEGARVFTCITNNSVKNMLLRKEGKVFLKVDGEQISGKGQICNAEGRNGYLDDFEFSAQEISNIKAEDYNGQEAIAFDASLKGLYGNKKIKVYLPQLKDADAALALLKSLKQSSGDISFAQQSVVTAPRPVARPEAPAPQPVVEEPAPQPKVEAPAPQPRVEEPAPIPTPVPQPRVETPAPQPRAEAPAPVKVETSSSASTAKISEEEFELRMTKLETAKECDLLSDSEYTAKKFELLGEFYGLGKFYEKIQKLVTLKDCGFISEKEFEENRQTELKKCCDVSVTDINEYKTNIQKLNFLEIGEVITDDEYRQSRLILIRDVAFSLDDSKERFTLKLKRLPILKECHLIDDEDFDKKVADLFELLEVESTDSKDVLVSKINKWPLLVWEKYMDTAQLQSKQNALISRYLDSKWSTPEELRAVINNMMALREGECLTGKEFQERRQQLLAAVDDVESYASKVAMYKMLPEIGFINSSEYEELKKKCIDKIFVSTNSVTGFKERANNLVELQKVGMLTAEEFTSYKNKLMSEL